MSGVAEDRQIVQEMLERFSLVYVGKEILVVDRRTGELRKPSAVSREYSNRKIVVGDGDRLRTVNPYSLWEAHPDRTTYERITFDPGGLADPTMLNRWRGFPVEPKRGAVALWLEHTREVICAGQSPAEERQLLARCFFVVVAYLGDTSIEFDLAVFLPLL